MPRTSHSLAPGRYVSPTDLASELARFAEHYGGWLTDAGEPCCYRHFQLGVSEIMRTTLRETITGAAAASAPHMTDDARRAWLHQQRQALGWER
jgi:hypothetical protein